MKTLGCALFNAEGEITTIHYGDAFDGAKPLVSRQDAEDIINQRNGDIRDLREELNLANTAVEGASAHGEKLREELDRVRRFGDQWHAIALENAESIKHLEEEKRNSQRLVKQWQTEMEEKNATLKADVIREQNTVTALNAELNIARGAITTLHEDLASEWYARNASFPPAFACSYNDGVVRADSPEDILKAFCNAGWLVRSTTTTEQVGDAKLTESTVTGEPPVAKAERVKHCGGKVSGGYYTNIGSVGLNALPGEHHENALQGESATYGPINVTVRITDEKGTDVVLHDIKRIIAEQMEQATRPGGVLHKK